MALTEAECRKAGPRDKPYTMSDVGGLQLYVLTSGRKSWRFAVRIGARTTTIVLGHHPAMTLAQARRARDRKRQDIARGEVPMSGFRPPKGELFREIGELWIRHMSGTWKPDYRKRVEARFAADIYPVLGDVPVGEVTPAMVLDALRRIEAREAHELARRMRQNLGQAFRYAIASGLAERDPTVDLGDALQRAPRVQHRSALGPGDLPEFFAALRAYQGEPRTVLCLRIIMHTFVRTGELRGARRAEFEGDLWRIPAARMKAGEGHLVPLTPQVQGLFAELRALEPRKKVVPYVSENTMLYALYRMGFQGRATVHGFRGLASTALNESALWRPDVIERQLAHRPRDAVRAAYDRALMLPERVAMMQWWSDWLDRAEAGAVGLS
jgi:integrase